MSYIEREAVLLHLNEIWLSAMPTDTMYDDDRQFAMARCMGLNDAMDAVKDAPASDVRPVVTCADCKYSEREVTCLCGNNAIQCITGLTHRHDWFCADGKKREES